MHPVSKRSIQVVDFEISSKNKKRKEEHIQSLTAQIVITCNSSMCQKNAVWMSPKDIALLYPQDKEGSPHLIQLANRIYHVHSSKSLEKGKVIINRIQRKEIENGIFHANNTESIFITTETSYIYPNLNHISIIFQNKHIENRLAFNLDSLRRRIHQLFNDQIFIHNQRLYFEANGAEFPFLIKFSFSERNGSPHKKFIHSTKIDFSQNPQMIFFEKLKVPDTLKLELIRWKITGKPRRNQFYALENSDLKKNIVQLLCEKNYFFNNDEITIRDKTNEIKLDFKIEHVRVPEENITPENSIYHEAFKIDQSFNDVVFQIPKNYGRSISLYNGTEHASSIKFEILNNSLEEWDSSTPSKTTYVCINELSKILHLQYDDQASAGFLPNLQITANLENGKFDLVTREIDPWISKRNNSNCLTLRTTNVYTKFSFFTNNDYIKFVDDNQKILASSVMLKLKPISGLNFQKTSKMDKLKIEDLCRKKLQKYILKNQFFSIKCLDDSNTIIKLQVKVKELTFGENQHLPEYGCIGELTPETKVDFVLPKKSKISFNNLSIVRDMAQELINLENLVGGVSVELKELLRRVILSRGPLKGEYLKRGLKALKGMLLYGPPGNGKTTLARKIGNIFGCKDDHVHMLNASELTNKWVGGTEDKIRSLFAPAEEAMKKKGGEDELHLIVIDEVESILPPRSDRKEVWYNSWVNQFLGKLDGLEETTNVFVIFITNRKDLIDEAILRPGRIELELEFKNPDLEGRKQIFNIHLKTLREANLLKEINVEELAKQTGDFSGAQIEGLVKEAASFTLERLFKLNLSPFEISNHEDGKVTMEDFQRALKNKKKKNDHMLPLYI